MYGFIYSKCLDRADSIETFCRQGLTKEAAKEYFDDKIKELMTMILDNEHLNCTISIHRYKAVFSIEGTRHVVAVIKDL